jgi:hypothetical protein
MHLNEDSIRGKERQDNLHQEEISSVIFYLGFVDIAFIGSYTFYSEDYLEI